jgi:hypothetical protein
MKEKAAGSQFQPTTQLPGPASLPTLIPEKADQKNGQLWFTVTSRYHS